LSSAGPQPEAQSKREPILLSLLLAVATLAVYYPVRHLPFINYDDDLYVTENVHVQSGLEWDTVQWAFTTNAASNWHPLTWLSHALDFQLFGLNPAGPHVVNLLLHTLNVLLLFWALWRATGFTGRSAMVAALFALHPINVQSVAWVAERKNLLSMVFFLLALDAYRWYAQSAQWVPQPSRRRREAGNIGRYFVVALIFALGLMAKPQVITLPLVLLLWDYWPLRRVSSSADAATSSPVRTLTWLAVEKLPLFALAAGSAVVTLIAHRGGALRWLPLSLRIANAIESYTRYVKLAFWPSRLALFYPHPGTPMATWTILAALLFLAAVTLLVVEDRRRRYLLVGWFWFLITLSPMIGIVQVGTQAMADRYAYLPFIGLFIMIVWGVADWFSRRHVSAKWLAIASVLVLIALSLVTHRQLEYWRDSVTLWAHTLEVTRGNYIAEIDLGAALVQRKEVARAMEHFRAAAAIDPQDPLANMYIGRYAQTQNNLPEAIEAYKKVIAGTWDSNLKARAYRNMGYAYRALGDEAEAQKCFRAAADLGY
jgi:protein O-mannosyl-transferase